MPRGRIPRPWYRKHTDSWYVHLDGKSIPLGKDKRAAHAEFNRLMAARGRGVAAGGRISVADLASLWLEECERTLAAKTVETYRQHAEPFARTHGGLHVADLRPYHVRQWAQVGSPAQSTVHLRIAVIRRLVSWGKEEGYIDLDPLGKMRRPKITRRAPITLEEAQAVMDRVSPQIATALRLMLLLGVRPGELCSLEARGIDLEARHAIVTGKTGRRTVPLAGAAVAILADLVRAYPTGPLLHSARGVLTPERLQAAVYHARQGLPGKTDHIMAYCFRGLFATEGLRRGVDPAIVSRLLGHRDGAMLWEHYAAPDHGMLLDWMEQATAGSPTSDSSEDNRPDPRGRTAPGGPQRRGDSTPASRPRRGHGRSGH